MARQSKLELEQPRSIRELLRAAFTLYLRVPVLFIALAAVVVVPWEVILLLVTGRGPLDTAGANFFFSQLYATLDAFLVAPLVSALHVHAVREVGDGERPRLIPTFRRSLPTLAVVAIATGISWLAITIGSFALLVPGLLLWARWAVVAQTAAMEGGGWKDALRRSAELTDGYRWHALGLVVVAAVVISGAPILALGAIFGHKANSVASFLAGTAVQVLVRSFEALAVALLYFDLKARLKANEERPKPILRNLPPPLPGHIVRPSGHPEDAASYSDEDRPPGWYVDRFSPDRMRYWGADGTTSWSEHTAKTPKQTLLEWQEFQDRAARGEPMPPTLSGRTAEPIGHPLDPASYSDENRPPGWYVIPDAPWQMRYWAADGKATWGKRKAKTPKQVQAEWQDLRFTREKETDEESA